MVSMYQNFCAEVGVVCQAFVCTDGSMQPKEMARCTCSSSPTADICAGFALAFWNSLEMRGYKNESLTFL